jgi:hypothetical protein
MEELVRIFESALGRVEAKCPGCGIAGCERGTQKDIRGIPEELKVRKLEDNLHFLSMCDRFSMRPKLIKILKEKMAEKRRRKKGEDSV